MKSTMPGYKGHIVGGLFLGGAVLAVAVCHGRYRPDTATAGLLLATALMGALFPDVDTDSKGQNFFYATRPTVMVPWYLAALAGYLSHLVLDRKF